MGTPFISDDNKRREWDGQAKDIFDQYVSLLFGHESITVKSTKATQEDMMRDFYETRVKPYKPKMYKDENGKIKVTDLPKL